MIWPRWLAWLAARLGGYFWIPCPVCKEHFAGFEAAGPGAAVEHQIYNDHVACKTVCSKPACKAEGVRQHREFYAPQIGMCDDRRPERRHP